MSAPITCEVRYRVERSQIEAFVEYAHVWVELIQRYGGTHHGYFIPRETPPGARVSFQVGSDGSGDTAIALFTFPDEIAYQNYRRKIADDPDGIAANKRFGTNPPFGSYERFFLEPIPLASKS